MRLKSLSLIFLILTIVILSSNPVMAEENATINNINPQNELILNSENYEINNLTNNENYEINNYNNENTNLLLNEASSNYGDGKIITVDGSSENQMVNPTIQDAIDSANPGDTILITGTNYVHVHIIVNKAVNIISNVQTTMSPCPSNTEGSGGYGIFYINEEGSEALIYGFTITNTLTKASSNAVYPYGIYVNGGNNVTISNCNVKSTNGNGIYIANSNNVLIDNIETKESENGILIYNSTNVKIQNITSHNNNIGINVSKNVSNVLIENSNISTNALYGLSFSSSENATILNNIISCNRNGIDQSHSSQGAGIYVDTNVTLMTIKGNFIWENGNYGIFNTYRARNLNQNRQIIDNNFIMGHNERAAYTTRYVEDRNGQYDYNSIDDTYYYVGIGGHYSPATNAIYVWSNAYQLETMCGATTYGFKNYDGSLDLIMSNVSQINKGIYSISFIYKNNGSVAEGLNSVPIIFFLNKVNTNPNPSEGDIYKVVTIINGTAIVDFRNETYQPTNNILTIISPGYGTISQYANRFVSLFNIKDSDIPIESNNTIISGSDLSQYYGENKNFEIKLTDSKNNPLSGEKVTITINGAPYNRTTNSNGIATINIKLSAGNYTITYTFKGNEEYEGSNGTNSITITKMPTTLTGNDTTIIYKNNGKYEVILSDLNNNPIANQIITLKINGASYTRTTDSNGEAKLNINLNVGTYTINVNYPENNNYNGSSITNTITVKNQNENRTTTKINSNDLTKEYKDNNQFIVSLTDKNNNTLSNQKIQLTINGVTYNRTTNSLGEVKFNINLNVGNYTLITSYLGDNIYQSSSANNKIIVNPKEISLIGTDTNINYQTKGQYTVKVIDVNNNNPIVDEKIQLTINGVTYSKTTNITGDVKLNINLNPGVYTIKSYGPIGGNYKAKTIVNIVTVVDPTDTRTPTTIISSDLIKNYNESGAFKLVLTDNKNNKLTNEPVSLIINNVVYSRTTDSNGEAKININLKEGSYKISTVFSGDKNYLGGSTKNIITVIHDSIINIPDSLNNEEIQKLINSGNPGYTINFIGKSYDNISLIINKPLNIISESNATLNGKSNSTIFTITSNGVNTNISNLNLSSLEGSGILINNTSNIHINNNNLENKLVGNDTSSYYTGDKLLSGNGISVVNSDNINIDNNTISLFYNGIYLEYSDKVDIAKNYIYNNNYGINYDFGVTNTIIESNDINYTIGKISFDVPEGPLGYGIFLNNSGVNVTIINNYMNDNYIGIFIDSNKSTGIVITGNLITQSTLEGLVFYKHYDLATEDYISPVVTNNSIYNNAKGPGMFILGEVSANPEGIYGPGEWDPSKKLNLGPNWYGANILVTWDLNGTTGAGTICPRISTSPIYYNNLTYVKPGEYDIIFLNNGSLANKLPDFTMYATLNGIEKIITIHEGKGTFTFDKTDYINGTNVIEVSCGSLTITSRIYKVISYYTVPNEEIPN